jgi:hypothetical protein
MALIPMSTEKVQEGMHSILYGDPKTGKTTTLGECGFKVLLGDAEGGSAVLEGATNITRIPLESFEDVLELGKSIRQGFILLPDGKKFDLSSFDLIAMDSWGRIQDLCKEWVANVYAPNRKREIQGKFGALADWGDLEDQLTKLVKAFHRITKSGADSKHVMWIAHKMVEVDGSGIPVGTKIQLQGKKTPDIIMSVVDSLFYMVKQVNVDPQTQEEKITYGILTDQMGIFTAAVRQSKFKTDSKKLPKLIANPNWKKIFMTLGYKGKEEPAKK